MDGSSTVVQASPQSQSQTGLGQGNQRPKTPRRRPRKHQNQADDGATIPSSTQAHSQAQDTEPRQTPSRQRTPQPRQQQTRERQDASSSKNSHAGPNHGRRGQPKSGRTPNMSQTENPSHSPESQEVLGEGRASESSSDQSQPQSQPHSRQNPRRRFAGKLSSTVSNDGNGSSSSVAHGSSKNTKSLEPVPEFQANDLTSHLTHLLKTAPYPDCPICYSAVHPLQPTWSCSSDGQGDNGMECCWTTFHMKCIRAWSSKSVKETKEAYLARNEEHPGEWRCPNCQCKRTTVPSTYKCFCGSISDPRPPRFATPHSCASPCTRSRKGCEHPCPLQCHPGPCPPCAVILSTSCHCGKEVKTARCSHLRAQASQGVTGPEDVKSCGSVCAKNLTCGDSDHTCEDLCHPGTCKECEVVLEVKCWCGRETKEIKCGADTLKTGWGCLQSCAKIYRCGIHKCEEPCHPHFAMDREEACPFDPDVMQSCPCGKVTLEDGGGRKSCQDPVHLCGQVCGKELGCGHTCQSLCHVGPCAPCTTSIERKCRCGTTTTSVLCHTLSTQGASEFLCSTPCPSLRSCGRHQCNTRCCPASSLHQPAATSSRFKKKKPTQSSSWQEEYERMEREQLEREWHTCDMRCGKLLTCGTHYCEESDHRGVCPPCLRSSFDELICHCSRTTLLPPIPCGTKITCPYPCTRPPPPCGHDLVPHNCHEEDVACPPCPYLTEKTCMCGKNAVKNVRCSSEKVGCGVKCGKVLDCGFHHCEKLCHAGECETCTTVCGKDRKLCLPSHHPCELPCHAPFPCDESEPCRSMITLSCPCGRIKQPAPCLRSSNSSSVTTPSTALPPTSMSHSFSTLSREIKCTPECGIAARNARLADALGISKEVRERGIAGRNVEWPNDLKAFAKANSKFVDVVEKAFADFLNGDRKTTILPSMPESKRNFVQGVGEVYRVTTQAVDKEPHRSISLTRRIDSRIPKPLLSSVINAPLGKLADLRQGASPSQSRSTTPSVKTQATATTPLATGRGWTSVVAPSSTPLTPAPLPIRRPSPLLDTGRSPRISSTDIPAPPALPPPAVAVDENVDSWDTD